MTTLRRLTVASAALVLALGLAGCAPEVDSAASGNTDASAESPGNSNEPEPEPEGETEAPIQQAASCEWDLPRVSAGDPIVPEGTAGDLAAVLVGSWQHTHVGEDGGFEAVDNDIRYVFPSAEELIYCQHVPGVTEHAENQAAFTIEGTTILPPSPHKGFEVLAWSENTMLWKNNYIPDTTYLLVRR